MPTKGERSSIVLFVGFSDDRRIEFVRFGVAVFVLGIIIVVGVSRRHRVAHDGDEAPVDQPAGNVLEDSGSYVVLFHF